MILGPVSLIDCAVFCAFLAPQLLLQVGLFTTLFTVLKILPFLLFKLPVRFVIDRYWRRHSPSQSLFVQRATAFEYFVVSCVRYAFRDIPASVVRIFFSKTVALPFMRWRMLRHGYLRAPVQWREQAIGEGSTHTRGTWIMHNPEQPHDIVVYYIHGGGFAMGSSFFYLEFLLAWHHLLLGSGFKNPAIFALDYTLVPEAVYPTQVRQAMEGYKHVLGLVRDASKICVAGDSAGGTLVLSLLLELGSHAQNRRQNGVEPNLSKRFSEPSPSILAVPRMATLISPWVTLMSSLHNPSSVDYLNRQTLWKYAQEYAKDSMLQRHPASPGNCADEDLWEAASPERGFFVVFGSEEVFAPDIENFVKRLVLIGVEMEAHSFDGAVHAWPVASLFLSSTENKRLQGLRTIVGEIRTRFSTSPAE